MTSQQKQKKYIEDRIKELEGRNRMCGGSKSLVDEIAALKHALANMEKA